MAAKSVQVEARPFAVELDPQETAVIVVDMQRGFFGTGGAWNRAGVDVSNAQAIIAPIARVLAAAREVGMPIIYATMDLDGPAPAGAAPGYWTEERFSRWVAAGEPKQPMSHAGQLPPGVRNLTSCRNSHLSRTRSSSSSRASAPSTTPTWTQS